MVNEKYGVIRTDLMAGTTVGTHLVSLRYFDAEDKAASIENGCVVKLEGLMEGERELHKAVAPTAKAALKDIAIIATPEVLYDERKRNLSDFINPAGANCRAYRLHQHDAFGLTIEAFHVAEGVVPAKDYVVELMDGNKLNVAASATSGATQVGVIEAVENAGRYTYYVVRVA